MAVKVRKPTRKAQRAKADRLFSLQVRGRGYCQAHNYTDVACNGTLQCAHLVPRRYLSVRWDLDNAVAMCAAHHSYFTYFPLSHEQFCIAFLGPNAFDALKKRAREARGAPDYEAILARLVAA